MIDFINDSVFLKQLYGNKFSLKESYVSDVNFSDSGPSIRIHFHITQLPQNPPKKWIKDFNMVAVSLNFIGITNLRFTKWNHENYVNVEIYKNNNNFVIQINSDECNLQFKSKWIFFEKITPYLKE